MPDCTNEIFVRDAAAANLVTAQQAELSAFQTLQAKEQDVTNAEMAYQSALTARDNAMQDFSDATTLREIREQDLADAEAALAACQGGGGGGEEAQEGGPYPDAKEM